MTGPWLGLLVQMAFDRWRMVEEAIGRADLSGTILLDGLADSMTSSDMRDFERLYITDEWNHHLYGRILEELGGIQIEYRDHVQVEPWTIQDRTDPIRVTGSCPGERRDDPR